MEARYPGKTVLCIFLCDRRGVTDCLLTNVLKCNSMMKQLKNDKGSSWENGVCLPME